MDNDVDLLDELDWGLYFLEANQGLELTDAHLQHAMINARLQIEHLKEVVHLKGGALVHPRNRK